MGSFMSNIHTTILYTITDDVRTSTRCEEDPTAARNLAALTTHADPEYSPTQ